MELDRALRQQRVALRRLHRQLEQLQQVQPDRGSPGLRFSYLKFKLSKKMEAINEKQALILELKAILFSTDYKVVRSYETGVPLNVELIELRANARAEINRLDGEIEELKNETSILS